MKADQYHLSSRENIFLLLLVTLAVAPHFIHLNILITLFYLATAVLRLLAIWRPGLLPGRLLLFLFTVVGFANVLEHYPLLFGKSAGIALLVSMLGLKLLELRKRRDLYVIVFLGYFVIVTQFFFNQEMVMAGYLFLVVAGLTTLLVEASRSHSSNFPLRSFAVSLSLLLQSLPIMLALFLFFPRFS